jgi:hypothetical protein
MPYYRHHTTGNVAYTEAGSEADQELAADPKWGRTTDDDPAPAKRAPAKRARAKRVPAKRPPPS